MYDKMGLYFPEPGQQSMGESSKRFDKTLCSNRDDFKMTGGVFGG